MAGLLFYRFIFAPIWVASVILRQLVLLVRGRVLGADLRNRLGGGARVEGPAIWLHGASLGEIGPARIVAEALLAKRPDHALVITANAPHAARLAASWNLPRTTVRMAPLDLRVTTRRFLRRVDCRLHITIENELWPNRFILLDRAGVPIVAISARMSARSLKHWRYLGAFPRMLIGKVRWLSAQAADSRANIVALGLPEERLLPDLNLKALIPPKVPDEALLADLAPHFEREATMLGASTHPGEEAVLLDAFVTLADAGKSLILAPRRTDRGPEIAELARARGLSVALRSRGETPSAQVYVADTLHEMPLWYTLAGITFVGGSLEDFGGHTPFEPAAFESVILHGPHTSNFGTVYPEFDARGAALRIEAETLAETLIALRADPSRRESMRRAAREMVSQRTEGLSLFIDTILP